MKWDAIIFDLDDTLYPEREYVLSGFRAVAAWADEHLGIQEKQGFEELKKLFLSGVRGDTFNRWLSPYQSQIKADISDEIIPTLIDVYRGHKPQISPFPEIPDILKELKRFFKLGLLSDGYLEVQQRKFEALGLANFFEAVLFTDELGRSFWKPHTKPFEVLLQRLCINDPEKAVYIADNPLKDFLGANKLGMTTVWYHCPDGEYSKLSPPTKAHEPHAEIFSLSELMGVLGMRGEQDSA